MSNKSYLFVCACALLCMFSGESLPGMGACHFFYSKNKSFRPRERGKKGLKNLQSVKTLAGRAQSLGQLTKARKHPLTVTAQFQQSLNSLMITLNQANPFFIRCIKSNSDKVRIPNLCIHYMY